MKTERIHPKKKKKKISKKPTVVIFAIDPATTMGWATNANGISDYGVWRLARKDETIGMRLLRLRGKLEEVHKLLNIKMVAYERPGSTHAGATIHQSKLIGIIESWCAENDIEVAPYPIGEIKKYATGKGNAGKPAVIAAAQKKLNYTGNDDNEADALWLLELAKRDLNLL